MKAWKWMVGAALVGALGLGQSAFADGRDGDKDLPDGDFDTVWEYLLDKYDADADGEISRKDYGGDDLHWERLDKDGDGKVVKSEGGIGVKFKTKAARSRKAEAPKLGAWAPKFELEIVVDVSTLGEEDHAEESDSKREGEDANNGGDEKADEKAKTDKLKKAEPKTISLESFRGDKPVALIFGSYT
jgi:hypothetical protein